MRLAAAPTDGPPRSFSVCRPVRRSPARLPSGETRARRRWEMIAKGPRAQKRLHEWIDERSRALDARIADRLRESPELIAKGLETLDRWERTRGPHPAFAE